MKASLPYVIFEVTSDCNLNCRYCYNIWKIPGSKYERFNSYSEARKTLKRLFKIADVNHVTFTGGEPMLAERIEELVLYVRMKKKSVTMITNGSGASDEQYKTLVKLGVNLFEIPVHSARESIHDEITRVPGSWKNSIHGIQLLKKLGVPVVPVVVITKINAPFLGETLSFIKEQGYTQIMLNRYNIGGEGFRENERILMDHDDLRKVYTIANELGKSLKLDLSSNVCTPFCLLNPEDYKNIAFGSCSRDPSRMPITVDIHGNLRLCNHSPVIAGNIFSEHPENIFSGQHITDWLKNTPEFCNECAIYEKCLGGCRAASLQAGLSGNDVDPVMTVYIKKV
jgi:radical SAM protein with 4Fe4S-binding SPASM domain